MSRPGWFRKYQAAERAPDLLDRDFVASAPNRCWVADFTHVATWNGVVYVAFVVDTFSRRIVGWSAATVKENRLVLDSIFYVLRSGCQWRMLPRDLMPWDAAHRWFTKWREDGTWDRVHDELRRQVRIGAGRDPEPSATVIDAQSIKTSEGGEARGFDAGKRTPGRKRHMIVDTMGLLLLVVAVTSASVQDRAGGRTVLTRLAAGFRTVGLVWADGGYANSVDSTLLSWARDALNIVVEIVKRTDDVKGFKVLPRRWVVERSFGWLVRNRRLDRDYERLTATSEAMIKVALIRLMLVRLAGQPSRWSHESHRKTARTKTIEDLIAA